MAGFKDFVDLTVLTESDLDDYLAKQAVMKFASAAARDAAVTGTFKREGMVATQDDTNTLMVSRDATLGNWSTIGPVHGALTSWTPVVVQGATPTLTNNNSVNTRTGRWVQGKFLITITSTATAANLVTISLPFTAVGTDYNTKIGFGSIYDASSGFDYSAMLVLNSNTTMKYNIVQAVGAGAPTFLGTTAFTAALVNTDVLAGTFMYEAAADA